MCYSRKKRKCIFFKYLEEHKAVCKWRGNIKMTTRSIENSESEMVVSEKFLNLQLVSSESSDQEWLKGSEPSTSFDDSLSWVFFTTWPFMIYDIILSTSFLFLNYSFSGCSTTVGHLSGLTMQKGSNAISFITAFTLWS